MRLISPTAALIVAVTATPFAQAFIQYSSRTDFFAASFPGEPNVRATMWASDTTFPCRHGCTASTTPEAGTP